jgi:Putative auto-transporter adhesin, head GIN domain
MRRFLLQGCCLLAALPALACEDAVHGNGQRATETRPLTDFTAVESATSVDVAVEQGDAFDVTVSIDSNILPRLRTRVVGDTLVIDSERDFEDLVRGPHVRVTLPDFRAAELSGSGHLGILVPAASNPVDLTLSGSGGLAFEGTAPETTAHLSGSGDMALDGSSERVGLWLDGSGDLDAVRLHATTGRVGLDGSGSIRATLSGSAEIDLSGSGDIYLYGAPELTRLSIDGSGELHMP